MKNNSNKMFDLEKNSKLMVDPRMLDPTIENDYGSESYQPNYTPVIDSSIFPKVKTKSYLRIIELTKSFTEDELTRVINKTLEQILRPNCSTSERKRLSFDLKRLLQGLFLRPVYTGDVNPLINMIDLNFVNDLIDTKFKLGITHAEKLTESEISLLQEYQEIRKL